MQIWRVFRGKLKCEKVIILDSSFGCKDHKSLYASKTSYKMAENSKFTAQ